MTPEDAERLQALLFAKEVLPCERKRYFALWHAHQGQSSYQIEALGLMNADSVRKTIHAYRTGGLDALKERVHPGRQSPLAGTVMTDVLGQLKGNDQTWNTRTLKEHIKQKHGLDVGRTAIRRQLHHAGMSWQRTRYVVAGQADPQQKEDFKTDLETVKKGH